MESSKIDLTIYEAILDQLTDSVKISLLATYSKHGKLDREEKKAIQLFENPTVTEHELKKLDQEDKHIKEFVKRNGLLTTPQKKYGFLAPFEIFEHNIADLRKFYNFTNNAYDFAMNYSELSEDTICDWFHLEDYDEFDDQQRICAKLFRQQIIMQTVQILEVYWDDILKLIYNRNVEQLILDDKKNQQKTVDYKTILSFEHLHELKSYIVEEVVAEHKKWYKRKNFFKKLKIDLDESGVTSQALGKLIELRNLLIHRKGIIDKQYIKNTKDKSAKEGEEIEVSYELAETSLANIHKLAQYIDKKVIEKYF